MRKQRWVWIIAGLALSASCVHTAPAMATTKKLYAVAPEKQAKSKWCWAACGSMIVRYFGGTSIQSSLVDYIYPGQNFPDKGASDGAADRAIDHFQGTAAGKVSTASLSFTAVKYQIGQAAPVYAGWSWTRGGGHALVIRGYDDASPGYVMYVDPAVGVEYKKPYSSFKSASDHVWDGSIYYR